MASFQIRVTVYESKEPFFREYGDSFLERKSQLISDGKVKVTNKTFNVNMVFIEGKVRELDSYLPKYLRTFRDEATYPYLFVEVSKLE